MPALTSGAARRLHRQLRRTIAEYELLEPGDRVLVAVSGGKDSLTLPAATRAWRDDTALYRPFTVMLVSARPLAGPIV